MMRPMMAGIVALCISGVMVTGALLTSLPASASIVLTQVASGIGSPSSSMVVFLPAILSAAHGADKLGTP